MAILIYFVKRHIRIIPKLELMLDHGTIIQNKHFFNQSVKNDSFGNNSKTNEDIELRL